MIIIMKYVLNAMQDLDKAINKANDNIILAKLSINQTLPQHLLTLENKTVALLESDFSKLTHFKDLFLSGDVDVALYYAGSCLETACRDMIPPSTYEIMGGRLLHRKDMLFDARVVDYQFKETVGKALSFYKDGNIAAANEMEALITADIEPYAYKNKSNNNFKP